jgi:hypothetical protein
MIINGSSGVSSFGSVYHEVAGSTSAVIIAASSDCRIEDIMTNVLNTCQAAVHVTAASHRCKVACQVTGATNAFGIGYKIDGGCTYSEYNCTGLNPAGIATGSANKMVENGVQITAVGTTTYLNLASGIMA